MLLLKCDSRFHLVTAIIFALDVQASTIRLNRNGDRTWMAWNPEIMPGGWNSQANGFVMSSNWNGGSNYEEMPWINTRTPINGVEHPQHETESEHPQHKPESTENEGNDNFNKPNDGPDVAARASLNAWFPILIGYPEQKVLKKNVMNEDDTTNPYDDKKGLFIIASAVNQGARGTVTSNAAASLYPSSKYF